MSLKSFLLMTFTAFFFSCAESEADKKARENLLVQGHSDAEIQKFVAKNKTIPVEETNFFGIELGAPLSKYETLITKGRIRVEEGIIEVYNIEQGGVEIGYLLPDSSNSELVGNIFIQSPKAVTSDGFKIGTTFKEIVTKYPTVEINNTEVESRTIAKIGNIYYHLDFASNKLELNRNNIPETAKVVEIRIGN